MIVVNLFAGPCAGKSTTAAGVFHKLKMDGINCELVTEVAKDFTWEEREMTLKCQPYVFAKQMKRLWRLKDKVDVVVTDSPILMSVVYAGVDWPESFNTYVVDQFHKFNNLNVFLRRDKSYSPVGRGGSKELAILLDDEIMQMMLDKRIPMTIIKGDSEAVDKIIEFATLSEQWIFHRILPFLTKNFLKKGLTI